MPLASLIGSGQGIANPVSVKSWYFPEPTNKREL
jgi:thiazole synthase ThiGH ThiG subunit